MLGNHFKIFLRSISRSKLYSAINLIGLAVGMATCIIILLFVQNELSFEKMHTKATRIYRVLTIDKALGTNNQRVGITMPAIGPALPQAFPEVTAALRVTFGGQQLLRYGDRPAIYAQQLRSADANFFDFFDYQLLEGDPATALTEPFSLILTQSRAQQIFGDIDPMGKSVRAGNGNALLVTGILADLPDNTHLAFDALGSMGTVIANAKANQPAGSTQPIWVEKWRSIAMPTYIMLAEGVSTEGMSEKLTKLAHDNSVSENFEVITQPLADIHLKSTDIIFDPVQNKGDVNNVYIFTAIALLILIIAAVNYMNLSTARSTERAKEVGLRKVVGSRQSQLMGQFLSESFFTTAFALIMAIPLALLALPSLNQLMQSELSLNLAQNGFLQLFIVALLLGVGLLAGLYPATILSGFKPITVLKGNFKTGKKGTALRVGLVIFQFSLSIALIGATATVQKQLHFVKNKDLGYNREQVLIFDMFDQSMGQGLETFRQELLKQSAFISAAQAGNVPGRTFGRSRVRPEGVSDEDVWIWSVLSVTPEVMETFGMEVESGRNFNREMPTDTVDAVMINATAAKALGWDEPINKRLYFAQSDSVGTRIIGVVKDFHFAGLHQNIEPVIIFPIATAPGNLLAARIQPGRISEAIQAAENAWLQTYPNYPFSYSFLDEEFDNLYRQDLNTGVVVNIFSGIAILIACLGLFALASYSITQRTKEIGVRKVVGASTPTIIRLLVVDFIKWVALANIIALPLAWYVANKWLENFAYRINVDVLLLLGAGVVALLIAMLTVLSQSWRAALLNPSQALHYE